MDLDSEVVGGTLLQEDLGDELVASELFALLEAAGEGGVGSTEAVECHLH